MASDNALDGLDVDHARLQRIADDLMSIVRAIDARMQALERELAPLRAGWVGDAQQAYAAAKARWDGAITEMWLLLHSTSEQVNRSDGEYQAADARGARSFDG
jgi:early secretory antigenic target protein ESAT-6